MVKDKTDSAVEIMDFFINGDWHYENSRIQEAYKLMSPEEAEEFDCDCRAIDWPSYLHNYIKGLAIWALNEDQISPEHGLD